MMDVHINLPLLTFLFFQLAAGQAELIVSTDKGKVRGLRLPVPGGLGYVRAFLGIPYAKPPLDLLRFKKTVPAEAWHETRDATQYANSCFQLPDTSFSRFPRSKMSYLNTNISEDCLYLNVWTSNLQKTKRLVPVMVWIHGGSFSTGSTSLEIYDGRYLSHTQQVVVVSMNYRLGALGFLSLPGSKSIKGNAALFDQRLALSWVSKNIAAFGGDPSTVTLFGGSAGACSVGHHLLSQGSRGLFNRAILQSGSPNDMWGVVKPIQAWNRSLTLAQLLNCPLGPSAVEMEACLRTVEPEKIVSLQYSVPLDPMLKGVPFLPTVDGEFLVDMPSVLIQSGRFLKTKLLLGLNRNEGTYFIVIYGAPGFGIHNQSLINRGQLLTGVSLSLPGFSDIAKEAAVFQYTDWTNEESKPKNRDALGWLVGDHYFSCPLLDFAHRYVENGGSAHLFLFNFRSILNPWPQWMGVMHGDEVPFVFGTPLNQTSGFPEEEVALSRRIMEHWSNFARSGDPNVEGADWPTFTLEHQRYVMLNTGPSQTLRMLRAQQCKFWDSFLPKLQYVTVEFQWKSPFNCWLSCMLDWKNQFNDYTSVKKQQCENL